MTPFIRAAAAIAAMSCASLFAPEATAQSALERARQAAVQGRLQIQQSPDLRNRIAKSNAYIGLMNRTIRISDAWSRYTSWVNLKTGPNGKERYIVYGIYSVYDVRGELEKARTALGNEPSVPDLDAAMKRYADAVETVSPIINRASAYYDRQDYKTDNAAEAKKFHAELMPAMENFLKARNELKALFRPFKRDLDRQELAAIEAGEGKKARWHTKNVISIASDVIELLPSSSAPVVDMKVFSEGVNTYAAAVRELDEFAQQNPGEGSSASSSARNILGRLRELHEKLDKAKGDVRVAARRDMMLAQGHSINQIVQDYNTMVQISSMDR